MCFFLLCPFKAQTERMYSKEKYFYSFSSKTTKAQKRAKVYCPVPGCKKIILTKTNTFSKNLETPNSDKIVHVHKLTNTPYKPRIDLCGDFIA